ncbi:nitric oxide synthase, salivary gland-like [Penaeus vannamei]|uniref:nitric oxide synthase, salivary gland-like n=1 Tax=Penaeus vannamei TaxID=6689 RepID=UPI00387F82A8
MVKKACPAHPQRLANFSLKKEVVDTLQSQTNEEGVCSGRVCGGSLMNIRRMSLAPRPPALVLAHAKTFLDQYYRDIQGYDSAEHKGRWQEVSRSVAKRGTYDLTFDELVFGAKLAWRNAPRCVGRMQWKRLQVFDARHITTAQEMFEAICKHLEYATDGGNLRSTLTVFPQRQSGRRDFRVWNPQLIAYAGYRADDGSVTGDPAWAEFTQVCQELGWQGGGGRFDVLPLVVSTPTEEPQWFDIPDDLVLRVALEHPKYDWFGALGLEWFALPAVSGMMLDCGGVEFTAAPFNGWYLSSEIASRDLCDAQRYNIIKEVGDKLGLDTRTPVTLWKDQAALEVNIAVLHSYQQAKVTLVDHHTVSESFMQFFANEHRERGGCPADWVWIVPPISGSLTPVFHQEMSLYYLKPAYEYQELAWVAFHKQNRMLSGEDGEPGGGRQRLTFRMVALAVWFSSVLYTRALSRRVRATILYATETGKSQTFAHELADVFRKNFSVQVRNMKEYEASALKDERFLLVVAPTAGNGDPPLQAQDFVKDLYEDMMPDAEQQKWTFREHYNDFKINGLTDDPKEQQQKQTSRVVEKRQQERKRGVLSSWISRLTLRKSSYDLVGHSNGHVTDGRDRTIYFAVFALGASNYKYFCAFGRYMDHLLGQVGGTRVLGVSCGDDLDDQRKAFARWSSSVLKAASEVFQVDGDPVQVEEEVTRPDQVKLSPAVQADSLVEGLTRAHKREVYQCVVVEMKTLYERPLRWVGQMVLKPTQGRAQYDPGDHVGVLAANPREMVTSVLRRVRNSPAADAPVRLLLRRQTGTWVPHPQLPATTLQELLARYVDLSAPPSQGLLFLLASCAANNQQAARLSALATDTQQYQKWRAAHCPSLPDVLAEFPSISVDAALLLARLPPLRPRLYSISSDRSVHGDRVHLTVGSIEFRAEGGEGPVHLGLTSGFLKGLKAGDTLEVFTNKAPNFSLPEDPSLPILLVATGVGVAPFRSYWHHLNHRLKTTGERRKVTLYFGCRSHKEDLYYEEKASMLRSGALTHTHLALSREPRLPKTYVQDLLLVDGREVYRQLVVEGGYIYMCGNDVVSEGVHKALRAILQDHGNLTEAEAEDLMARLKEERRYREEYCSTL